jgi:DNA-binding transcriptional ArsR family regulator
VDAIAQALADPIRRDILRMLREGAVTAGAIAGAFSVTRPAISRHLRVLREAGLVRDDIQGRERHYTLELGPLGALEAFVAELRAPSTWERRFVALETEVHRTKRERRRGASVVVDHSRTEQKETA